MGSLLKKGVVAYGIKEVVTRVQQARKPKRSKLARFGVPALIGTAIAGGVAFLATTGRLPLPGRDSGSGPSAQPHQAAG